MKAFNFAEFNKDGNKFITLSFKFNSSEGLTVVEKEETVSVRPQQIPASGCDFCSQFSSINSEGFFEVSGLIEPNGLHFVPTFNHSLTLYTYALPENKDKVKEIVTEHLLNWIKTTLADQAKSIEKALSAIA